ncbi:sacsin N-terminal ATP-binding-like domain-containing protein [Leifsonia sp. EB34]|uniref:DEAD/DEAH box helicase n=1 Tax=Leifsonia sp. EB34 TaxID=3156303 RepID=UPI00351266B3
MNVYAEDPTRVLQDANNERRISQGGYSRRQLEELLQNAVDAARDGGHRVEVVLTRQALYVANDGEPFDEAGVRSLMASDISTKDDERIGKFGIGFKSVLAVSDSPKILSRTVSFEFNRSWSEATLKDAGYAFPYYPAMRLAKTLDARVEASRDTELARLMEWASTVILIPLAVPHFELSKQLYEFPAEFVLFSPHIRRAELRNLAEPDPEARAGREGRPSERLISQEIQEDGTVLLRSGRAASHWAVTRTTHTPSRAAFKEAGHVAARREIELQFALPLPPGTGLGSFWAYFPTAFETTLSGLINAPWKLSDDRTGLLASPLNTELLQLLPPLVGGAISRFDQGDFPAGALDALPARGREARNWADQFLNEPIFDFMRGFRSLPDGIGALRLPSELRWVGEIEQDWLSAWAAVPGAPLQDWVHPDAYRTPERRLKVERLMLTPGVAGTSSGLDQWLEALTSDGSIESSAHAIELAARIIRDAQTLVDPAKRSRAESEVRQARIIRLEDGEFRAPQKGKVFVRVVGQDSHDVAFVDRELAELPGVRQHLADLGVVVMDRTGELHALLARVAAAEANSTSDLWGQIWTVLRTIPLETSLLILREALGPSLESRVRVRSAAGHWVAIGSCYLAGAIVPADGSRDRQALIDPGYHREDVDALREMGAVDAPTRRHNSPSESWLYEFKDYAAQRFIAKQNGAKPDRSKLLIEGPPPPWPMEPLIGMSDQAKAAATDLLVAQGLDAQWTVRHVSNAGYGQLRLPAAEAWFLRRHGRLRTSFGLLPPPRVLVVGEGIDPDSLPAVQIAEREANAMNMRADPSDYAHDEWLALKQAADRWTGSDADDQRRSDFYAWLPGRLDVDSLVVRVGAARQSVDVGNIGVTADRNVYESLIEALIPALLVREPEDVNRFTNLWSMPSASDLLQEEVIVEPAGESSYLTDVFPPIKLWLKPADFDLLLQPVRRLERLIATSRGQVGRSIPFRREGETLFVTGEGQHELLGQISSCLALDLSEEDIARIIQEMMNQAVGELTSRIRESADDDARLIEAVGVEALRRIVPALALTALETRPDGVRPDEIASLARAVHGVSILKQLRLVLDERGLQPPREWAGRRLTRRWVESLGFPTEWAGFADSPRPAVEMIDGPAMLSGLHDYQVEVTERITSLLRGVGSDRGLVSLPTGAGKTRVTVQALVEAVANGDISTDRPVVWIAQTDELCEQAAESWSYVWRAMGPQVPLRLGRLWASNELAEETGAFQLVVATIDKLESIRRRGSDDYDWIREPSVVVVDEAHVSIGTLYTAVLEWLGRGGRSRDRTIRRPLIGLTATPFRGTSEVETERLVKRYDGNRLDRGSFRNADDPYGELQEKKVLARVSQTLIDGTDVRLSDSDVAAIESRRQLPAAVNDRLGSDLDRTLRVIESIAELPEDWTVLVFAPSVENSRVLAALLSHRGVRAVSISADTEAGTRRHYIDEFKAGRIRVIANYGVLAQGFDAPRVRAVYVARPTFSPNVYQQMVGRGLRGPENGGSEEVLIVNVRDTFEQFGELLAFNEFEYLWTRR